jgi:deoxyribodipyrimidine photolyase-related protein
MASSHTAVLVFPHQIFSACPLLEAHTPADCEVYLLEEYLYFKHYNFHKQKLILHRASMKMYADVLTQKGYTVHYIDSKKLSTKSSLNEFIVGHHFKKIAYTDVVDDWLEKELAEVSTEHDIERTTYETPMFLTPRTELASYKETTKQPYFMKNFYEWQRKRLSILVDEHKKPVGGRWSFDTENRKKVPKDIEIPPPISNPHNEYIREAITYVASNFAGNIGTSESFNYAIDFKQARACLDEFIHNKLAQFGPYEDAIDQRSNTLFHSVLTPYLNIGLLQPHEVVDRVLQYAHKHEHEIPLESLEGFIRQIIGWREYMRFVYENLGSKIRTKNYFRATRTLAPSFWNGTTGILPVDATIHNLIDTAYCHHIPRLMVLGNFMNLCGFKPDEVYVWFMELFIDSYDWVMVPNVYSMALYADGGLITTKPYISSSNYILSMSDYKKGSSDDAPDWSTRWTALYWNFIDIHFKKLQTENRLGFAAKNYLRMDPEMVATHKRIAAETIARLSN